MATKWYVRTGQSERGPLTFLDVAFLIHDHQLPEDGMVRRDDLDQWQPANTVVGLIHKARRYQPLDERVVGENEEVRIVSAREKRAQERADIVRMTVQSIRDEPTEVGEQRTFLEKFMIWAPLTIIIATIAYATWTMATYDPFKHKKFESSDPFEPRTPDVVNQNFLSRNLVSKPSGSP